MKLARAADNATLLCFEGGIERAQPSVHAWFRYLRDAQDPRITNLHPAYDSILIEFDLSRADHDDVERLVSDARVRIPESSGPTRTVDVDVSYGGSDGPDLDDVARVTGLSSAEVVRRHASVTYRVAFLGFAPGFAYLLGLPPSLAVPRREVPRAVVPAGSVAIGGDQTAIYPTEGPGGWRLIGRASRAFTADWVEPGDSVRFRAI